MIQDLYCRVFGFTLSCQFSCNCYRSTGYSTPTVVGRCKFSYKLFLRKQGWKVFSSAEIYCELESLIDVLVLVILIFITVSCVLTFVIDHPNHFAVLHPINIYVVRIRGFVNFVRELCIQGLWLVLDLLSSCTGSSRPCYWHVFLYRRGIASLPPHAKEARWWPKQTPAVV
jgi:hypothetical protein